MSAVKTQNQNKQQDAVNTENASSNGSATNNNPGQSKAGGAQSEGRKTLEQTFELCLQDIYSAEKQLLEALPKMARAAEDEELQDAFMNHLEQTERHVERLEKIFNRLGLDKNGESCKAMEGLIEEGQKVIDEYEQSAVKDVALIIGAQKIEHYEIAVYGSLCELAEVMGYNKVADILDRTLEEEEETDLLLTDIARGINEEALEMSEDIEYSR